MFDAVLKATPGSGLANREPRDAPTRPAMSLSINPELLRMLKNGVFSKSIFYVCVFCVDSGHKYDCSPPPFIDTNDVNFVSTCHVIFDAAIIKLNFQVGTSKHATIDEELNHRSL
jgi:hypothetical protein